MVKKSAFLVELSLVLLVLVVSVSAQNGINTGIQCWTDVDCTYLVDPSSYCEPTNLTCFIPAVNTTNQSTNITPTVQTPVVTTTISNDSLTNIQSRLNTLEADASQLQSQISNLSQKVNQIDPKVGEIEGKLDQFNNNLQSVNYQQEQNKEELRTQLNRAVTGLAVLQNELNSTQQELNQVQQDLGEKGFWLKFVSYVFLTLVIVTAAIFLAYYINIKRKREKQFEAELTPNIHAYLTQQIKLGKKFPQIKDNLMQSGWSEEEARWAYKETMRHNYNEFKNKSVPKEAPAAPEIKTPPFTVKSLFKHDVTKVLSILIFATLLVLGTLLILRGVTTGKAIYQQEGQEALDTNVRTLLEDKFMTSTFYDQLTFADLCVQVVEGEQTTSYRVLKTSLGYSLQKSNPCDWSNGYDFAFKFTDYASFDSLMNDLSCNGIRNVNLLGKKLLVLPSKYILPGFALNPEKDVSKFCPVIKDCANAQELSQLSINC